jgi:hypothetical protein
MQRDIVDYDEACRHAHSGDVIVRIAEDDTIFTIERMLIHPADFRRVIYGRRYNIPSKHIVYAFRNVPDGGGWQDLAVYADSKDQLMPALMRFLDNWRALRETVRAAVPLPIFDEIAPELRPDYGRIGMYLKYAFDTGMMTSLGLKCHQALN